MGDIRVGELRVGVGTDSHEFGEQPPLVLGGLAFDDCPKLVGHSDGDAVCHAIIDALLGPAGFPDIGTYFPDDDPAHAGADSSEMLRTVVARLNGAGWHVGNVDVVVIADRPKLSGRRGEIQQRLSEIVGAPVTLKGKTTEGMPYQAHVLSCTAVALIQQNDGA